jgi:hypothetical protein
MTQKPTPEQTALRIYKEKFPDSKVMFLAGSVMRGEGTEFSDLDIVVVYEKIEAAFRDSFFIDNWPVEVFVHDPETLNYFFQKFDTQSGIPSLLSMVLEGKEIPGPSRFSTNLKEDAKTTLEDGPAKWTSKEIDRARYMITDICGDLRKPRSPDEMIGSLVQLYESLTTFYFRSQDKWSAKGKSIPKRWKSENLLLAQDFLEAFGYAFKQNDSSKIISFSEQILKPFGGWYFDGSKTIAPSDWRIIDLGRMKE